MKPNDKAIEAARAEGKRWQEGLNRPENQIPCWKVLREADDGYDGYDVIAKFNSREGRDKALERLRAEAMVDAAYAAQFKSEDYADVIKSLRVMHDSIITDAKEQFRDGIHETMPSKAADAIEALLAERDALKAELEKAQDIARVHAERIGGYINKIQACEAERDALAARLATVDDEALVEIVGRTLRAEVFDPDVLKVYGDLWAYDEQRKILKQARAAIAAIRPHIEAAERERCAKAAKGRYEKLVPANEAARNFRLGRMTAAYEIEGKLKPSKTPPDTNTAQIDVRDFVEKLGEPQQ